MAANGQLPASQLALIPGTNQYIRADLVGAVTALRAAFKAHFGKELRVTDGYRSDSSQERIFRERYTTNYSRSAKIDKRTWNGQTWWRLPGYASASTPGQSNHGWGQAIDFGSGVNTSLTSAEHRWMRANAPRFGWTHPAWARKRPYLEPWHWEGVPVAGFVNNPGSSTGDWNYTDTPGMIPDLEEIDLKDDERAWLKALFEDRKKMHDAAWTVGQIKPQTDRLRGIQEKVDLINWGVNTNLTAAVNAIRVTINDLAKRQGVAPAEVDEQALAAALVPLITDSLSAISDADVDRIAKAAANEQAKRLGATPDAE